MKQIFLPKNTVISRIVVTSPQLKYDFERIYKPSKSYFFGLFEKKAKRFLQPRGADEYDKSYWERKNYQTMEDLFSKESYEYFGYFLKEFQVWEKGIITITYGDDKKEKFLFATDKEKESMLTTFQELTNMIEIK